MAVRPAVAAVPTAAQAAASAARSGCGGTSPSSAHLWRTKAPPTKAAYSATIAAAVGHVVYVSTWKSSASTAVPAATHAAK